MLPLRLAVATHAFDQPLKKSILTAGEMGAQGVHFDLRNEVRPQELSDTGRRQLIHFLGELNLNVASTVFPTRRAIYDLDELEARLAGIRRAMEMTFELGAKVMACRIGRIPSEPESQEAQILPQVLNDLARHGNRVGATLAITPTRDDPAALKTLLEQVTEGPMGVNYDPAVFVMGGFDPIRAIEILQPHLMHVIARDGIRDMDGSGLEVPLGRGEVTWEEVLALLDEADYHDWVTANRTQGNDPIGDITRALQYLRTVATE